MPERLVTEKDSPAFASAAAKELHARIKVVRDVFGGTETVRAANEDYLPKHAAEEEQDWRARRDRAVLFNALRRTVKGLTGMVFRKDPAVSDELPDALAEQLGNADNAGRDLPAIARDLAEWAFLDGMTHVLVDFPTADGEVRTLADERAMALRPYWVPVAAGQLINWRHVVVQGRPVLTMAVIREDQMTPDGAFGERQAERVRVLRLGEGGATWQVFEKAQDSKEYRPTTEETPFRRAGGEPLRRIPLVTLYVERTGFMESSPPLLDLAYENVHHFQVRSDHAHALHVASIPIPVFVGRTEKKNEIQWGPSYGIDIPEGGNAFYMEPKGASLAHTRQELKDIEARMAALGLQMLVRETRAAETAEAKLIDKAESDSALAQAAASLERGLNRVIGLHAEWLGLELPVEKPATLNRDFTLQEMSPATMQVLVDMVRGEPPLLSIDTLWDALEAGEIVTIGDRDLERERIESAGLGLIERLLETRGNGGEPQGETREPAEMGV